MASTVFDFSSHPGLDPSEVELVRQITTFTEIYFQNPKFDASHDFNHVLRVVRNAVRLLDKEQEERAAMSPPLPKLDTSVVILAALLHDVDDKKYIGASDDQTRLAKQELLRLGVPEARAELIQTVVDGVSYSSEIKDVAKVQRLIESVPELAIVQDADRLDAIGAIGIGRCFAFGAAKSSRVLGSSIEHFEVKLLKLEGMMKTKSGKALAEVRSRRIEDFMKWWDDEVAFSGPA